MSAFGRLWSRAPLWRRSLFVTAVAAALAIAYPPGWLADSGTGQPPRELLASVGAGQGPALSARPEPAPVVHATDPGLPVAGTFYAGRLPLGEQSVPLPPGRWLALAVASPNASDAPHSVNVFLALVLDGRINAAAVIGGSTAPDPRDAGFAAPLEAQIPPYYYRRVLSAADHGAMDFWLVGASQPARWTDPLRQAAVNVIRQQGLVFADRLRFCGVPLCRQAELGFRGFHVPGYRR